MDVARIDEGLWRWTAPHPEWKPQDDWDRDVGCVYWEADDAVVLIDPLVPDEPADREHFLASLDRDVERSARPVSVLLTCEWHERSATELAARYDGRVVKPYAAQDLPGGIGAIEARVAEEVVYWLAGAPGGRARRHAARLRRTASRSARSRGSSRAEGCRSSGGPAAAARPSGRARAHESRTAGARRRSRALAQALSAA